MENPIKMDDLGENPYCWKHPYVFFSCFMKICAKKTLDLKQEILEESLRYIVVQLDSPNNAHRVVK